MRAKADRYAQRMAGNGWMAWFFPFVPAGFLVSGRWDRPLVAVPAMLVLLAAVVAALRWWRRMTAAAQRWVEDPPGPEREPYVLKTWERWVTGRRFMWLLLGFLLVGLLVPLALVLALN